MDTFHSYIMTVLDMPGDIYENLRIELKEFIEGPNMEVLIEWIRERVKPLEEVKAVKPVQVARERSRSRSPPKNVTASQSNTQKVSSVATVESSTEIPPPPSEIAPAPPKLNVADMDISDVELPVKNGKSCVNHPYCTFGPSCMYTHPGVPCRFGDECYNSSCNWLHSEAHTKRLIKLKKKETEARGESRGGRGGRGGLMSSNKSVNLMMKAMMQIVSGGAPTRGGRGGAGAAVGRGGFNNLTVDFRKKPQQNSDSPPKQE
eukprot:GDKJ01036285.1.p1 GENE.GDKJ01036285.1~~GDKJ01036285.1.p1  ORF type:complete len:292 (-),score=64.91 GDKJ01036285.1:59-841(-)